MGWESEAELAVGARRVRAPSTPVTYRSDRPEGKDRPAPSPRGALSGGEGITALAVSGLSCHRAQIP